MSELLLAVLAVWLRAPGIGKVILTDPEARIIFLANESWSRIFSLFRIGAEKYFGTSFPHVLFVKLWMTISDSILWFRLPALVFGLGVIVLTYMIAQKLFGTWAARAAALMMVVSPYHIMMCRSGTSTAAAMFLLAVAIYTLWLIFEGRAGIFDVTAFAFSLLVLASSHYFILLFILPANVLVLGFGRKRKECLSWWIPLNIALLVLCAFWWTRWVGGPLLPSHMSTITSDFVTEKILPGKDVLNLKFRFLFIEKYVGILMQLGGFFSAGRLLNGWSVLAALFVFFLYQYMPFAGFREYEDGYRPRLFEFMLLAAFIAAGAALSFTAQPPWTYLMPATLIFYAVCGNGLVRVAGWRTRAFFLVTILTVLFGCVPTTRIAEGNRPDWPRAAEVIKEKNNINAPVVFIDGWKSIPFSLYAPDLIGRTENLFPNFDMKMLEPGRMRQDALLPLLHGTIDSYPPYALKNIAEKYKYMWVVRKDVEGEPTSSKHVHEYKMWLNGNPVELQREALGGGFNLILYSTQTSK